MGFPVTLNLHLSAEIGDVKWNLKGKRPEWLLKATVGSAGRR